MLKRSIFVLLCFSGLSHAGVEVETERKRNNGQWEMHCKANYPDQGKTLEQVIGHLKTQCEIAALRLSVKQHARSGEKFVAEVSRETIDSENKTVSVIARLIKK